MSDVVMPRLSDSMEEGTIVRWLKADGDAVRRGEEIVEIETDKATMTYEADADGVLSIEAEEGVTLAIGAVIARIDGEGAQRNRDPRLRSDRTATPSAGGPDPAVDAAGPVDAQAPAAPVVAASPAGAVLDAPATAPPPVSGGELGAGGRVKASPVARRVAREQGVELGAVVGSGPGGRIVKADVEAAADNGSALTAAPAIADVGTAKGEVRVEELSRTQQVIARRMAESRATVPDFSLQARIDMERAGDARAQLKELAGAGDAPSLNDMIVKACALALRELPRANGAYRDGRFELYSRVNVGVAVAADDALVVPTVFDADAKPLAQIAVETRALAERVRAGTITPPELAGQTFTVSNLGMFGISNFNAVINPPQAAILAVGAIEPKPAVVEGAVTARRAMDVTLSCDHRILYGADAARFLGRVRELLEHPVALTG